MMAKLAFPLIVWVLAGCAVQVAPGPIAYQDGWRDGCQSGEGAAGYIDASWSKDVERFNKDKLYAQGWTDAYDKCKTRFESTGASLDSPPIFCPGGGCANADLLDN
jgi:hypothetical protein